MHTAAIRAQAEAELAILRGAPQIPRCRAGQHVGGPGCHEHADPRNQGDHLPIDGAPVLATPLEVWAAQRPLQPRALPLEVWAAQR